MKIFQEEMGMKVLNATWYSPLTKMGIVIGIVKVDDYGEIKYYIGLGEGEVEKRDIGMVLDNGSRFYPEVFEVEE